MPKNTKIYSNIWENFLLFEDATKRSLVGLRLGNLFFFVLFLDASRTRLGITVFEQARFLTKAAALILTVAGTAE
jgi:hypothetical protein